MALAQIWRRIPELVRAVVAGLLVAAIVTVPWAILVSANLKYWPSIPWSALVTGPMLWLYWQYLKGKGWPRSTVESRRANLRPQPLSGGVWAMSLFAAMIVLGALLAFQAVLARMVSLPPELEMRDISKMPADPLLALIVLVTVVLGFT